MMADLKRIIETIEAGIEFGEKMHDGPTVMVDGDAYVRAKDIPNLLRRIVSWPEIDAPDREG